MLSLQQNQERCTTPITKRLKPAVWVPCRNCGRKFRSKDGNSAKRKFCSTSCEQIWNEKRECL